jgi:hypothetical protein
MAWALPRRGYDLDGVYGGHDRVRDPGRRTRNSAYPPGICVERFRPVLVARIIEKLT